MVEGMHFAINAMLTGGFNRNNSESSYAIMGHLKSCRTILPYYSTAFFISVAPLSALGWFISLFDTDVYLHISDGIDVKVFPTKVEDYIDLTSDIEEKDSTVILSPSSYTHETIETEIASYFGTYNTQDMRGVVILGENPLDNIKLKRRLSDIAESYIKGNKLKVYLYCNDGIAINEETNDSAAIHYYGEDNAVIPNVVTEISDDM